MKGIYIADLDRSIKELGGVYKKIQSQVQAFNNLGIEMRYIGVNSYNIEYLDEKINFDAKHLKGHEFYKWLIKNKKLILNSYDFVYLRYSFSNPYMFKFAKIAKENNLKVFIEIPTYPYKDEIKNTPKNIIYKKIDDLLWKFNNKYIDRLVLTTDIDELFGIKAINIFNGINSKDIYEVERKKGKDIVNLIGVANISAWHGYDRVIKGLGDYYKNSVKQEVNFYLVGEGAEKENLIEISKANLVEKYVHFLGAKFGTELDKIYNNMDIGVSSLALFRAGGGHDPIKSKEYVAKGIPVVIGYKDRALSSELPFVIQIAEDNSNVIINDILKKYNELQLSSIEISQFARENLTWESQIVKIVNYINLNKV